MSLFLRAKLYLIFALYLSVASASAQATQQQTPTLALITVSGQAEVKVAPDEVVFNLSVVKLDKDLQAAKEQNDQSVRRIMELARKYNIAAQDVQTDYISVEPKYREERRAQTGMINEPAEVKRVFEGYQVSKSVAIRLRDISRFESFLSDIIRAGIDRVGEVEFRTSEMRKYRDQARALAMRAARDKAVALTKEIGQTVGRAYSIREDGYVYGSSTSNTNMYANTVMTEGGSGATFDEQSTTIAPGMITVTARVTVSFRLL